MTELRTRIEAALASLINPRTNRDVLSSTQVRDLVVDDDGDVRCTFLLTAEDPADLVRTVKASLREIDGVRGVRLDVVDPGGSTAPRREAPVAPPTPQSRPDLGKVIAISSAKGGVGKSTVTTNLAVGLAALGRTVGLMDADVYGPNLPRMLGRSDRPPMRDGKIAPIEAHGVRVMSLGFLIERDTAAIWRGPIVMKVIQQFLSDVDWGKLDYLLVDLPPGTGDAQLSLVQLAQVAGAVIVTTPQEVAVGDALRGAKMFDRVHVPVIGVVENMSGFVCPHCAQTSEPFLSGGGERLAAELGVPLIGKIPLQVGLAGLADEGRPVVVAEPDSPAGQAMRHLVDAFEEHAGGRRVRLPIITH